ncbi:unnamed protein product [Lactuca saligna]|uniref:Uncharacterized protein n=1 Tax=Lactuca saligna TaxID=75948 RepID=A0AA36EB32_LACSI|nr:unnamed protein product [Lactuca saligna]
MKLNIPPSIVNLPNLSWLDLSDKKLKGPNPVSNETAPGLVLTGGFDGNSMKSLLDADKVNASHVSPCDIVAVIRPTTYKSGIAREELDKKYVMKDNFEMSLSVTFSENGNETNIYLGRVTPSSRKDLHAFTYFYHKRDSRCEIHVVKVKIEASCKVHKWAHSKKLPDYNVTYLPFQLMSFDFKGVDILIDDKAAGHSRNGILFKDSTIIDEDIDRIIAKGEEATAELDAKGSD